MSRRIVTTCICPPIPDRSHDWCAYFDGEEEAGNYGWGPTREEALADFMANAVVDGRVTVAESFRLLNAVDAEAKPITQERAA